MPDLDGFEENPQAPLVGDDEGVDESLFGPQKTLTPEEVARHDAWFRRKVQEALDYARRPDAVFYTHDEVMAHMSRILEDRIAEASRGED